MLSHPLRTGPQKTPGSEVASDFVFCIQLFALLQHIYFTITFFHIILHYNTSHRNMFATCDILCLFPYLLCTFLSLGYKIFIYYMLCISYSMWDREKRTSVHLYALYCICGELTTKLSLLDSYPDFSTTLSQSPQHQYAPNPFLLRHNVSGMYPLSDICL